MKTLLAIQIIRYAVHVASYLHAIIHSVGHLIK